MKNISAFIVLMILSFACTEKVPDGVIPENQMIEILVDIHIADAYITQKFRGDSMYNEAQHLTMQILKQRGLDTTDFFRSMDYYTSRPVQLDKMYDVIIEKLAKAQTENLPTPQLPE